AGLGLPPGVHDRAAGITHYVVVPLPGFGVDGLTHAAQQAHAGAGGGLHRLVAQGHQGADSGRRGIEDIDLVLVDDLPTAGGVRVGRHTLEHQGGGPVAQRSVDDIGVAGNPADVSGAPVHLALVVVEYVVVSQGSTEQVTAGGMQHALGLAGGAGGVEDEQRVLAVHGLRFAVGADRGARLV